MIESGIKEKFIKLKESTRNFSDERRRKQGRVYIPRTLLGISPTEFIAVVKNIKPVALWSIPEERLEEVKNGLKEAKKIYGLNYEISDKKHLINSNRDFSEIVPRDDLRPGDFWVSISRSKELVSKSNFYYFKKLEEGGAKSEFYSYEFGKLMGYPECCLKFANLLSGNLGNKKAIHENYTWSKAHIRSFMNSKKISPLLNIFTGAPLISHVPCNLDCQKSEKYASEVLRELGKENPEYANLKKYFLFKLNSLFFYYTHFILLEGKKDKNTLKYDDCFSVPFSQKESRDIKKSYAGRKFYNRDNKFQKRFEEEGRLIREGNTLRTKADHISVLKGEKKIGEITKEWEFELILI